MSIGGDGVPAAYRTGEDYLTFIVRFFAVIGFKISTDGLLRESGDVKVFTK